MRKYCSCTCLTTTAATLCKLWCKRRHRLICRYACFYVTRTCFNYVNPMMLKDSAIGLDLTAVGTISSLLPIAYAFSKGLSGFLGSALSPRLLLSVGLSATGLCCFAFGFGNSVTWFSAFWILNGLLQVRCCTRKRSGSVRACISCAKTITSCTATVRTGRMRVCNMLAVCANLNHPHGQQPQSAQGRYVRTPKCRPGRIEIASCERSARLRCDARHVARCAAQLRAKSAYSHPHTSNILRLQGLGSPACAKLLTQWYSSSERGTAWSIWTASNNVGGFAAPWIAGGAAGAMGWRYGMWVPAACAVAIASVIVFTITDKPTDAGFEPVEAPSKVRATGLHIVSADLCYHRV